MEAKVSRAWRFWSFVFHFDHLWLWCHQLKSVRTKLSNRIKRRAQIFQCIWRPGTKETISRRKDVETQSQKLSNCYQFKEPKWSLSKNISSMSRTFDKHHQNLLTSCHSLQGWEIVADFDRFLIDESIQEAKYLSSKPWRKSELWPRKFKQRQRRRDS